MDKYLELVSYAPSGAARPTPVLFVHGAWHGAWCWQEHFLPYFAQKGYGAHALSLRGHGASPGRERLRWTGIAQYANDVAQVIQRLPKPPVLVGHSMGAMVVQKYLGQHWAPAAVLLAPPPPRGVIATVLRILRRQPLVFLRANVALSLYPYVGTPALARELLFSVGLPEDQLLRHFARLQDESYRAFLDMLFLDLPRPRKVQLQPLVLGAAQDAVFSVSEVEAAAGAYGARAEIFDNMGHDMMLDAGWQAVADRIVGWLAAQHL
ncbi:MAG TPA: alpha/beta fold hydrolase [Burkholderiaceae bacterium]|nr:alpha/beta fold hydrolase [Burkholderiaceae bacterium]